MTGQARNHIRAYYNQPLERDSGKLYFSLGAM